ncbi:hypothetical protein HMPREF9370_0757 [Neisseria wadsworthii 9715]|uniref:Uncharacterized protein n=1 Tax=Neisseria wadsworthii 9715 TaxID=1030841 RepID=G4CNU8_9NEIS|nr:hypothetical protein HMPREF9370_0757 [Neisseria wadsworthii 9715]
MVGADEHSRWSVVLLIIRNVIVQFLGRFSQATECRIYMPV